MKENFLLFLIAFIVIAATFTSYTGISLISGTDAETGELPDNETTADEVFAGMTTLSSDEAWLQPLLLILVIFGIVVVFIIIYPFAS